ncbi:MAG: guanylate kinase [Lachnospiraceae bacterium]|nr:guanylate kinase [Lachnospiraceae bacterium]
MKEKGILTVVSGFSGAGKGTLMKRLCARYDNYALSISATTRKPRVNKTTGECEVDGVDYFFIDKAEFENMIDNDQLIEYASYQDNYYGTPKKYVEDMLADGRDVILEIEVQGAGKVKAKLPDTVRVFVTPPSAAELSRRLINRGTEDESQIRGRLRRATEEAEYMPAYDYILINDDLESTVDRLHSIIQSQKSKTNFCEHMISEITNDLKEHMKGD